MLKKISQKSELCRKCLRVKKLCRRLNTSNNCKEVLELRKNSLKVKERDRIICTHCTLSVGNTNANYKMSHNWRFVQIKTSALCFGNWNCLFIVSYVSWGWCRTILSYKLIIFAVFYALTKNILASNASKLNLP